MKRLETWITNGKKTPFYARKTFEPKTEIQKATASVCGLGQFLFTINGEKVGDHELDPGWTDYRKLIEIVEFDVTEYLKQGKNALGFEVGNGWFLMDTRGGYTFHFPEFMPESPNPYKPFGESLVLSFRVDLTYADGTSETIDPTGTKVIDHEVKISNVYGSEVMDASLRQTGFSLPEFNDEAWETAAILPPEKAPVGEQIAPIAPPIKVLKTYEAKRIGEVNGRKIYDLGQNISGILNVTLRGKAGDTVKIYPAEKLDANGDVDQMAKNWMLIDTCIALTLADESETKFRQKFTYFAGRYLGVDADSEVTIVSIFADAISSAWKEAGTFTTDDERYNKIYDLVEKAIEANMVSVHTDCPTIERFAWQEPNHLMGAAILYMKDGDALWRKFFSDMRAAQHTKDDYFFDFEGNKFYPGDGLVPAQAPCYLPNVLPVPGMGSFYDIIPWGSSIILGVRWHYLFYGDRSVIEENYDSGMRYLAHLKTKRNEEGFLNHGIGDWGNPDGEFARENVETAFLYADTIALAEFAEILGKTDDEQELRAFAEEVKENYNEKLLVKNENGRFCYRSYEKKDQGLVMTQAVEALPLYFGLVPEEAVEDIVDAFRRTLEERDAFASGEVGLPYIIQTAARYGMNELIARFITKPTHPSYYAFVLAGETTLGEYWEENPRSHCHDMMGHIVEWFYNGIAGLEIVEPGFKKVRIRPFLPEGMNEAHATHESPLGKITVDVARKNGRLEYRYDVPKGVTVVD